MLSKRWRQWDYNGSKTKLIIAIVLALIAVLGSSGNASAQSDDPDVAVIFLVDESLSSTVIAQGERETLYNTVRFLNSAITMACRERQCQTGVWRFSAMPAELVPLQSVEDWDELDFLRLEIGVQDRIDQSDFPSAFDETCLQMRRSSDAIKKIIVVLTDGQMGSQTSPNIAPVQRAGSISRTEFIEEIDGVIDDCGDRDVRLVTILLNPSDLDTQAGDDQSEGDNATQPYRGQEIEEWRGWSETNGGSLIEAPSVDDVPSVMNVLSVLGEILSMSMPEYVLPQDGKLSLGRVDQYRGSAQFEVIGLKPFRSKVSSPDGEVVPSEQVLQSGNRLSLNIPLPKEGTWVAEIDAAMDDNLYLVSPPLTRPMQLLPYLVKADGFAQYQEIPVSGDLVLEIETIPLGGTTPVVIDHSVITGTLVSPLGLRRSITFTADTAINAYLASPFLPGIRPEPGLYALWIPTQSLGDVTIETIQQDLILAGDPFVSDWYTDTAMAIAGSPFSVTVVVENNELMSEPPRFEFVWSTDGKSPEYHKETGLETRLGQYRVTLRNAPTAIGKYEVGVGLLGGPTVFGGRFSASTLISKTITLFEAPNPTPQPSSQPQDIISDSEIVTSPESKLRTLVLVLVGLLGSVSVAVVLWLLALRLIPMWYKNQRDPLAVHRGVERLSGMRLASRFLSPIRRELNEIHEQRLQEIEEGQKNLAVDISLKLLKSEQRRVSHRVTDQNTWKRVTTAVLELVNDSQGEINAIRTTAASNLFGDIVQEWPDTEGITKMDLVNYLYRQGFEPYFES
jgi:hypothetical protein